MPTASPCRKAFAHSVESWTLKSMLVSHRPEMIWMPKPVTMPMRGSSPVVSMAAKKPDITPTPRQLTT